MTDAPWTCQPRQVVSNQPTEHPSRRRNQPTREGLVPRLPHAFRRSRRATHVHQAPPRMPESPTTTLSRAGSSERASLRFELRCVGPPSPPTRTGAGVDTGESGQPRLTFPAIGKLWPTGLLPRGCLLQPFADGRSKRLARLPLNGEGYPSVIFPQDGPQVRLRRVAAAGQRNSMLREPEQEAGAARRIVQVEHASDLARKGPSLTGGELPRHRQLERRSSSLPVKIRRRCARPPGFNAVRWNEKSCHPISLAPGRAIIFRVVRLESDRSISDHDIPE